MTNDEKSIDVLTRCGSFSRVGAERYLETLTDAERGELVALHDEHAVRPEKHQGGRFRDLLDNVADRQAAEESKQKAAATPAMVGTGEP